MPDWNAERYHDVSSPQQAWGRRVLERLPLSGSERVLDLGCGTGRITQELHRRLPNGYLVAADRSDAMVEAAATWLREHAPGTGAEPFREFIATVCVRHHPEPLPPRERRMFLTELTMQAAADSPPFTLDYWRLNISARRPA